jgi:hypothetical protein
MCFAPGLRPFGIAIPNNASLYIWRCISAEPAEDTPLYNNIPLRFVSPLDISPLIGTSIVVSNCLVQLNSGYLIIVGTNIAPAVRPAVENKSVPIPSKLVKIDPSATPSGIKVMLIIVHHSARH